MYSKDCGNCKFFEEDSSVGYNNCVCEEGTDEEIYKYFENNGAGCPYHKPCFKGLTMEEIAKYGGFESEQELYSLIFKVPKTNIEQIKKFNLWQFYDATKEGLIKLIEENNK